MSLISKLSDKVREGIRAGVQKLERLSGDGVPNTPKPSFKISNYKIPSKAELLQNLSGFDDYIINKTNQGLERGSIIAGQALRKTNETLGRVNDYLTSPDTLAGSIIGSPMRAGQNSANLFISAYNQAKSGAPSHIPFTDKTLSPKLAVPLKTAFALGNLAPGAQLANTAFDVSRWGSEKVFGKESIAGTAIPLVAGFAVPGGESQDLKRASQFAQKLENSIGNKPTKLQEAFRKLPTKDRLAYLVGKFSPEDLELSAPKLWQKFENIEVDTAKTENSFNKIFAKWSASREMARTRGVEGALSVQVPKGVDTKSLLDRLEGVVKQSTPEVEKLTSVIRGKLDQLYKEAQSAGISMNYVKDYVPHLWLKPRDEVMELYRSVKGKPGFSKQRLIPSYSEGLQMGLVPKYQDIRQILGEYTQKLSEARANISLVSELRKNKLITPKHEAGFIQLSAEGFPKFLISEAGKTTEGFFYAHPEVAKVINQVFGSKQQSGAEKIIGGLATGSRVLQDISLSGGVPGTPVNAFSLAQYLFKEVPAGRFLSGPKAFWTSMTGANKYFQDNLDVIKQMQSQGIRMNTSLDIPSLNRKGLFESGKWKQFSEENPGVLDKLSTAWNATMSDATFKKYLPILQTEFYKDVMRTAISKGKSADEAAEIAGKATKSFYGLLSSDEALKQSELGQNILTTLFFAPKFRESILNFHLNTLKGMRDPLAPENIYNTRYVIGKIIQYGLYDLINQQTQGKHIWENPAGYKDGILIDLGDGNTAKVPFDSSVLTVPRALGQVAQKGFEGDVPGMLSTGVSKFASTGLAPIGDLARNREIILTVPLLPLKNHLNASGKQSIIWLPAGIIHI